MKIWLDDEREAPDETWTRAKNTHEALWLLSTNQVELLSLDHDLGEGTPSGYDLMKILEENAFHNEWLRIPDKFEVHSMNSAGRDNILAAIASIEKMWANTRNPGPVLMPKNISVNGLMNN